LLHQNHHNTSFDPCGSSNPLTPPPHQNCKPRKQLANKFLLINQEKKRNNMINIKSKGLVLSKLKRTKQPSSKLLKQD
jgi:hypothetical protein